MSTKLTTIVLATVIIILEPANAHKEKKRHSNKIESCGSAAVKTGKGRNTPPLRAGGAGALARGQNSDINTHALKEKREDGDYPSLFCFAPSWRPFVQRTQVLQGLRARPVWQALAIARAQNSDSK